MVSPAEEYIAQSREFLEKAWEALDEDDLAQASEKLWGAAAQMIKSVAQRRGWQRGGHRELFRIVATLAQETNDPRLIELFQFASSLHLNFYENWLPRDVIELGLAQVQELVNKLERI